MAHDISRRVFDLRTKHKGSEAFARGQAWVFLFLWWCPVRREHPRCAVRPRPEFVAQQGVLVVLQMDWGRVTKTCSKSTRTYLDTSTCAAPT